MYAEVTGLREEISVLGEPKGILGAFELRADNGAQFTAGSGLTQAQKAEYWRAGDRMLGTRVRINFEMLSDGGVPLKPIVDCVEYEA